MPKYLVRVDAINLYANAVGDCQQLSALRGGGLMLLSAIKALADTTHPVWSSSQSGRTLSHGASSLLCEASTTDAQGLRKAIETHLSSSKNDLPVSQATFAVSVVECPAGQFKQAHEEGVATNRWQQMQSASVVYPRDSSNRVCDVDYVRPARYRFAEEDGKTIEVSESVWQRYNYGRDEKQAFYESWSDFNDGRYVKDLKALCGDPDPEKRPFGNLGGKYALIHMDGNSFGKIQRNCNTADELAKWDKFIQGKRRAALSAILGKISKRPEWLNGKELRIETLLWGGDETIWVVPAWCGWVFLEAWFRECGDWIFEGRRLTHAAGMVFCHEKAPIHRVRDHAIKLTEASKRISRERNLVSYLVLESFDQVGRDIDGYRSVRAKPFRGVEGAISDPAVMEALRVGFEALKEHNLFQARVADLGRAAAKENTTEVARLATGLDGLPAAAKDELEKLRVKFGDKTLWPYWADLMFGGVEKLAVDAEEMAAVRMSFEALRKTEFPRSKIAGITRAIAANDLSEATRLTKGLDDLPKSAKAELGKLKTEFGEKAVWLHLAELWDYLARAKELTA